jgi:hypothetical protein
MAKSNSSATCFASTTKPGMRLSASILDQQSVFVLAADEHD